MELRFYSNKLNFDIIDMEIDKEKLEAWIQQAIPAEYLDHVDQIILVRDTEDQIQWLDSIGSYERYCYDSIKKWDGASDAKTMGINDPDAKLIIIFLDALWDTVLMLKWSASHFKKSIEIDPIFYMNKFLLGTIAHELRHIAQQNGLIEFSGDAEDDADEFEDQICEKYLDMVLRSNGLK